MGTRNDAEAEDGLLGEGLRLWVGSFMHWWVGVLPTASSKGSGAHKPLCLLLLLINPYTHVCGVLALPICVSDLH